MTKISVIITCYNVQEYIATAMQSIIDCGFDDLELIVVDDGSTDATCKIADFVGRSGSGFEYAPVYFSGNTIGGVACAANAGLGRATGDIVIFIDGDDWVLPHNIKAAVAQHLAADVDFTVCGCQEYWNDSGRYSKYPEAHLWAGLDALTSLQSRREALLQMAPFPWRKIYRRAFLERHNIRFPVGDFFYEDNPFHWETTVRAESFDFFAPPTHVHRMARAGQTVDAMGMKPLRIFEHARAIRNSLLQSGQIELYQDRYTKWLLDHILWCCRHVPASGMNDVFDLSGAHLRLLSPDDFWQALRSSGFDIAAVRKLTAIFLDKRFEFLREF